MQKEAGGGNPFRLSSFGDGILPLWAVSLFVSDATNGCPLLPTQSLEVLIMLPKCSTAFVVTCYYCLCFFADWIR